MVFSTFKLFTPHYKDVFALFDRAVVYCARGCQDTPGFLTPETFKTPTK